MKQLIQDFKSGELYVDDLDIPAISKGMVLVENHGWSERNHPIQTSCSEIS